MTRKCQDITVTDAYSVLMLIGRKAYSDPVRGNKDDFSPEKWEKEQKKKDLSKCKDGVNKHYGCPRDSSWNRNDARFARMEVERGVKGLFFFAHVEWTYGSLKVD